MSKKLILLAIVTAVAIAAAGIFLYYFRGGASPRTRDVIEYIRDPASRPNLRMSAGAQCNGAPFIFPTDGMIGFIWDDSFRPGHRHSGLDIFSGTEVGVTPVIAAYPGYLTREADWTSTIIIRVPQDPLRSSRQIWVYYTHMADRDGVSFVSPDFPPGTKEVYVEAGTILGYQGNYSGDPLNPTGLHLHISIVKDDGFGKYMNELDINNTYDPSPYFGLPLNANENPDEIPFCD